MISQIIAGYDGITGVSSSNLLRLKSFVDGYAIRRAMGLRKIIGEYQNEKTSTHAQAQTTVKAIAFFFLFLHLGSGNTSGLLGFWDGDKRQELLLPNGTLLDTNSSQRRIHHEFGQLCI